MSPTVLGPGHGTVPRLLGEGPSGKEEGPPLSWTRGGSTLQGPPSHPRRRSGILQVRAHDGDVVDWQKVCRGLDVDRDP